jgi:hypothetical protein
MRLRLDGKMKSLTRLRRTSIRKHHFVPWIFTVLRELRFILILLVLSASTAVLTLCLTCAGLRPKND